MIKQFHCNSCCKIRPEAGAVLRATAAKQKKKICAVCLMDIKAAKQ